MSAPATPATLLANLEVKVHQGRNLKAKDGSGAKCPLTAFVSFLIILSLSAIHDPYVVAKIVPTGASASEIELLKGTKSKIVKRNPNPMWNDTLMLRCEDPSRECLHLSLMQWSMLGASYAVGEVSVSLADISQDQPANAWYNLKECVRLSASLLYVASLT